MFKKLKLNTLFMFLPLTLLMFCFNAPQDEDDKLKTIMVNLKNALTYVHYSPKSINDAYSQQVYKRYLEMIDPSKRYFRQADIAEFDRQKNLLDDYLNKGDLTFYKTTTDRLFKRLDEVDKITQDILSKPLDFTKDETLVLEPEDRTYPKDGKEQYAEWRKYIKYNILQEIEALNAKEEAQQKKKDSVQKYKLQDTIKLLNLTPEQKMQRATSEVRDLISSSFKRIKKRKRMDWFTVYMNAYTEVFDPHTNYFSPKDKEDFDVNFTGKVIGIGAVIQEKKGNLYLGALTTGAPAAKSKQLSEGDKILKVRSMPDQEPVNVVGMLADEAVRLIRGKEGTKVTLTVEKKDKTIREVTMVREEVAMEDTYAKSMIVNTKDGKKYGLIYLPGFNAEFNKAGQGRNASDDVKNELIKLKAQNITGVILDLRNNGGGSLTEVGDIMGLFMNVGPYVQVKDGSGKIQTLKNKSGEPVWTGPLLIMQNELSASSSEILAGAMQDYGRAVILGSPQSYGKGTVQTFIELNRFMNNSDDFGALKVTIQKFYRISGESTQKKGIASDLPMKDFLTYAEIGERYDDFALPWDKIGPVNYSRLNLFNLAQIQKNSAARLAANQNYRLVLESAQWKEQMDKEKTITLNKAKFDELMKQRKAQLKKYESLDKYDNGVTLTQLPDEAARYKTDADFKKKSDTWMKYLKRDIYLEEALAAMAEIK